MYPLVSLTVLFIVVADFSSSNLLPDYGKLRRHKKLQILRYLLHIFAKIDITCCYIDSRFENCRPITSQNTLSNYI